MWLTARKLSEFESPVVFAPHDPHVVFGWRDLSGSPIRAQQSTIGLQPIHDSTGYNGHPTIVFDGGDDYLKLPTLTAPFDAGLSLFMAVQQEKVGGCSSFFEASNGPLLDAIGLGQVNGALTYQVGDTTLSEASAGLLVGTPQLVAVVHEPGRSARLRIDGEPAGEAVLDVPVRRAREQAFLGRSLDAACTGFAGRMSEVMLYHRAVNDEELLQIERFIRVRWELSAPD